jgi:hypothetical protein
MAPGLSCAATWPASAKRMAAPAISLSIMGMAVWQVSRWVDMVVACRKRSIAVLSDASNQ